MHQRNFFAVPNTCKVAAINHKSTIPALIHFKCSISQLPVDCIWKGSNTTYEQSARCWWKPVGWSSGKTWKTIPSCKIRGKDWKGMYCLVHSVFSAQKIAFLPNIVRVWVHEDWVTLSEHSAQQPLNWITSGFHLQTVRIQKAFYVIPVEIKPSPCWKLIIDCSAAL